MYALVDKAGNVLTYPYSVTDLVRARPDVCWPRAGVTDELAASFGVVKVEDAAPPTAAPDAEAVVEDLPALVDGKLTRRFRKRTLTAEEAAARRQDKAREVRDRRDERLTATDWTQLLDAPPATQAAHATYRQALRDVPQQAGFPFNVTWPAKP